ncbi:MAG: NAD-dependent epimerase/dehydratase family protein [Pedobacter sp.]|jgi:nucleoside-diphosphate-sugar epimerase
MKQTILGANGTIGKLLAKELLNYTQNIRLVSRNPEKINESDELFPADLTDANMVDKAIEGSDIVYLVVGFDYNLKTWQNNWPKLMKATIESCIKHQAKLVFFDNVYMYDKSAIPNMTEDSLINPPSKKGLVRKEIAEMLLKAVEEKKLNALIARAPDFYGPDNQNSYLIQVVYNNLIKGKNANWFINVNKKHSFIYTPDAAKATALLGNAPDSYNQVWHLPTDDHSLSGQEWLDLFNKEMNTDKKISILPMFLIRILGIFMPFMREMPEMMYQYDQDYFFNSTKFKKRFNFTPTSYQMGVKQIVNS